MKDSRWRLCAAVLLIAGCGRPDKTADVAQDSLLVRSTESTQVKTTTTDSSMSQVRNRVSTPAPPHGGVTQMHPSQKPTISNTPSPRMQPPRRINPPLVLPGRESTASSTPGRD